MVRTPCCVAQGLKKGAWTPEEDQKLIAYVNGHGEGGWRTLPQKAGLKRCGKSCRLRWANYLRPDIKRGDFSQEEEETIIKLHAVHGNKWSAIARRLQGRTDNEIKNYWNTHIRKRLIKKGIDPVTHKPILNESSESESDRKTDKEEGTDKAAEKSQTQDLDEHKKPPLSLFAGFLNKVANKFGRRVNQSVLTEIIEGGGSGGPRGSNDNTNGNNNDNSVDSECERSTSSSTSNLNLLDKITSSNLRSIFDNHHHHRTSSTSTFSDSSTSVSIWNECSDIDRLLSSISSDEDFMGYNSNVENTGFMNELGKILHEDGLYETNVKMVNERDSCTKGAFQDIGSCWDECMDLESYQVHDVMII